MTVFPAGEGLTIKDGLVDLKLSQLSDETVRLLAIEAAQVIADRDLSMPETAGTLAVLGERAAPTEETADKPATDLLIATVDTTGKWYTQAADAINSDRSGRRKLKVVPEDELEGRVEAWLKDDLYGEQRQAAISEGLYSTPDKPVVLMAVPRARTITHKELLLPWERARGGNLYRWSGQVAFLEQWPIGTLTGDSNAAKGTKGSIRFVAIETGYDQSREGDRDAQLDDLHQVQAVHPSVSSASILEGGVLAQKTRGEARPDWRDTYVRPIDENILPDRDGYFPGAHVSDDGIVDVSESPVDFHDASRRLVG